MLASNIYGLSCYAKYLGGDDSEHSLGQWGHKQV